MTPRDHAFTVAVGIVEMDKPSNKRWRTTGAQPARARCFMPTWSSAGLNSTGRSTSKSTRPHNLAMPYHLEKTSPSSPKWAC